MSGMVDVVTDRLTVEPTATFGIAPPAEIVGPLKPRKVHHGVIYASDAETGQFSGHVFPMVHMDFNKYRPDLPPWANVKEFVLADMNDGKVVEFTWSNVSVHSISITGDLKTVSFIGDAISSGVGGGIIERDDVAEKRGMGATTDTDQYKITDELT